MLTECSSAGESPPAYTGLQYCRQLGSLVAVTYDHNIVLYNVKEQKRMKQVG